MIIVAGCVFVQKLSLSLIIEGIINVLCLE